MCNQGEDHAKVDAQNPEPQQNQQTVAATEAREIGRTADDLVQLVRSTWGLSERDAHWMILYAADRLIQEQKAA